MTDSTSLLFKTSLSSCSTLLLLALVPGCLSSTPSDVGPDDGGLRAESSSGGGSCGHYPEPFVGSCTLVAADGYRSCDEYTGDWSVAAAEKDCASTSTFKETFSTEPCSTEQLVGRCVVGCGTDSQIVEFDYQGSVTESQYAMDCMNKGGSSEQWLAVKGSASDGGGTEGEASPDAPPGDSNCPATPDPITGTWKITNITCGGAPAPSYVQAVYTAPNSAQYVFTSSAQGSQVNGTVTGSETCTMTFPLAFSYPSAGTIVVSDDGPVGCSPSSCSPACGSTGTLMPRYTYVQTDCDTLVFTSDGANEVCATPVVYTLERE
jgi:hypothetical protein